MDFRSKGVNLTLDFFFILERAQAWAPGPGPQPLSGANWGHKVHRQGLGGTIWALGPRSFIKTLGPFGEGGECVQYWIFMWWVEEWINDKWVGR